MPLDNCIAKIKSLSPADIEFLRREIGSGATEEEAVANLEAAILNENDQLISRIESAGGELAREGDAESEAIKSILLQAAEDRKWARWLFWTNPLRSSSMTPKRRSSCAHCRSPR